ncbi:hypothetical protein BaRGS_00036517, partial [Batillaria attramentaria]
MAVQDLIGDHQDSQTIEMQELCDASKPDGGTASPASTDTCPGEIHDDQPVESKEGARPERQSFRTAEDFLQTHLNKDSKSQG